MQSRDLFSSYRKRVEEPANQPGKGDVWLSDLCTVAANFERDAAKLEPKSALLLCEELCQQFEYEADRAPNAHRRVVLLGAVKRFEAMSFPPKRD